MGGTRDGAPASAVLAAPDRGHAEPALGEQDCQLVIGAGITGAIPQPVRVLEPGVAVALDEGVCSGYV
jgi:hypothetical protein